MTAAAIVIIAVASIALVIGLAWPFLVRGDVPDLGPADHALRQLDDDLHRSLEAIKEIAFDRASGHLNEDDFAALDADERARAVDLMRQRDRLDETANRPA